MKFDGKDYPDVNPYAAPGSASSVRPVNERTLEETDKIKGKVTQTVQFKVSSDLKMLTMTSDPMGKSRPNILVFVENSSRAAAWVSLRCARGLRYSSGSQVLIS
jgi:hypothetical protein